MTGTFLTLGLPLGAMHSSVDRTQLEMIKIGGHRLRLPPDAYRLWLLLRAKSDLKVAATAAGMRGKQLTVAIRALVDHQALVQFPSADDQLAFAERYCLVPIGFGFGALPGTPPRCRISLGWTGDTCDCDPWLYGCWATSDGSTSLGSVVRTVARRQRVEPSELCNEVFSDLWLLLRSGTAWLDVVRS